jgi:RNA polymerase sigma-70 factor (ECF subfamily)
LDERELVRKILQGDERAKTEFYVAHRERLYRDCVYLLGRQDHEAEDVVQEAFITAFRKLPGFEFRASLGTWLTQIGIYLCYNRYRRRLKLVAREQADLEQLMNQALAAKNVHREQKDVKEAKLRLVEKCLEKIGKECREVVRLRDFEMSRLSRCKKALKTLVEQALEGGIG